MSKKLIITLSVCFSVVAVLLILFWTLFALSSVSVEYHSTTQNLTVSADEIVQAGQFRMGASVLFEGKKKSIENINNYCQTNENFAYIRVLNIETKFPNKFVIHISEREELFAVQAEENKFYICDRDLRVLRETDSYDSTQTNAILLSGLDIKNKTIAIGDFLSTEQESIKNFYSVMLANNRDLAEQIGKFKQIVLDSYLDDVTGEEYCSMTLSTFQNRTFVINNIDFALSNKVQKMFSVESALFGHAVDENGNFVDADGNILYVVESQTGEYVDFDKVKALTDDDGNLVYDEADKIALSMSLLANCYIKIDNLTLSEYVSRTENDIYYAICKN